MWYDGGIWPLGLVGFLDDQDMLDIKGQHLNWESGVAKNITFIVTKDCQLACKYCYLVGKNEKEHMPFEIAKAAVDYILDNKDDANFAYDSVIWEFIGGEPFLEIDRHKGIYFSDFCFIFLSFIHSSVALIL